MPNKENKKYICYDWYSSLPKEVIAHKNKNMDSYSKLSKNCKGFSIPSNFTEVAG
jgi:hypothetical protein